MRPHCGLIFLGQLLLFASHVLAQGSGVVISQIYGGGGNSGATLRNDFVELFNRGDKPVTVDGWSIQYASASGTSWDRTLLSGVIQPGQYSLIQEAQGNGGSTSLPSPDATGGTNLSATDGKVALVNNSTVLTGPAPSGASIIDFVGYGSANAAEGTAVGALTNTTAALRQSGGCAETNNNRADFAINSPAPRNSHSPLNPCSTPAPSKPDLIMTGLSAPRTGTIGGTLAGISAVVKNQGATGAGAFRVGYYLSPTPSITSSAVFTGSSCSVASGLATGGSFTCSNSVTVPSSLSAGSWYLLAQVDDQSQIDESDESNNVRLSDSGIITLSGSTPPPPSCGVERWSIKTGTDPDARLVNLDDVASTTVGALTALSAPANLPDNNRVEPIGTTVFLLSATLTQYKKEDDSDYHLVLQDASGRTMIAEIPLPGCVGSGSPFLTSITNARAQFDARLTTTTDFKTANLPVQVKGVGFFDFIHGQTGVAPNGIELHPVLDVAFTANPTITAVNTASGAKDIAQNDFIEIHGVGLAPPSVGPNGMLWDNAPDFAQGRMPTQLSNVSVKVNGKPAYVYYINQTQINALTPLDSSVGLESVVVTNGTNPSAPFMSNVRAVAPTFLRFGSTNYIAARHANGSLLGPTSMSVPGYSFTPAQPGETISLYGVGFGLPSTPLVDGASSQFGNLPNNPAIQIGGATADVQFAGVVSPGLYQFNVVVPTSATNGDNLVSASYGGSTTPAGSAIAVQR